jgi:hypothetical protein
VDSVKSIRFALVLARQLEAGQVKVNLDKKRKVAATLE